jgi:hypothetical protein
VVSVVLYRENFAYAKLLAVENFILTFNMNPLVPKVIYINGNDRHRRRGRGCKDDRELGFSKQICPSPLRDIMKAFLNTITKACKYQTMQLLMYIRPATAGYHTAEAMLREDKVQDK